MLFELFMMEGVWSDKFPRPRRSDMVGYHYALRFFLVLNFSAIYKEW